MKVRVELWVRLKVIDLVTQTARITLAEKLGFGDVLRGMTHYWYWGMDAEGKDRDLVVEEIDRAVRLDGAFTNQNKHRYRLAAGGTPVRGDLALEEDYPAGPDVPARGAGAESPRGRSAGTSGPGLFAFDCLVREKRRDRETGFAERLNARLKGVAVSEMKHGELWRIVVSASTNEAALADVERMLVSRSRREGLLLNPHYQEFEIIASTRVGPAAPEALGRAKE
jgi:hypothetical protein